MEPHEHIPYRNEGDPRSPDDAEVIDEERKEAAWVKIIRGGVAILVGIGMVWLFGGRQAFFFRETPPREVPPQETALDAKMLTVPLEVFVLRGESSYASARDEENIRQLVENASALWAQGAVRLELIAIREVFKDDSEAALLLNSPHVFFERLEGRDSEAITVILTRHLRGINGIAFPGLSAVAVADRTTVNDFRTLAHEVGHIFGLPHIIGRPTRLMFQGANGTDLTEDEIIRARERIAPSQ